MTTRIVIHSSGKARRVLLNQPPHFRRGAEPAPVVDVLLKSIDKVLGESHDGRTALYHTNGSGRRTN